MKVLTVKTLETISPEIQIDIHYIFKMEQHTDYVFKDDSSKQYSATISIENSDEVIRKIIEGSIKIPEYNIILVDLDTDSNELQRYSVQNGNVIEKRRGKMEWSE